ncbi:hypothetical protein KBZ20_09700 [Vulcanococcus limneticus Candia 3F8]|uniref:hypothetical protein n=1 Tax=Vulcanococcus limneticus TaxID=2170428 RepID=UPI000B98F3EA|nr:hypothetical protein [Vulcanococcus limneticus]MCP9792380.1 hypothetical protein [Vulcanococcus limneticus MW73D5]MCP9894044.1 hypothetical protein [Vulcanococcus limneticus Candia 3F8]MCP9897774.1 hypothetical protein [Vulcanococcus limneticus Candia 3B3]
MSCANPGSHTTQLLQHLRPHFPWALAFGLRPFPARAGLRVVGGVLAVGLAYYLWALVAMAGQAANGRTGFVTLAKLLRKLR